MLRITLVSQTEDQVMLKVEGTIAGKGVELLEQEGRPWQAPPSRLVLNLDGAEFIDSTGLALLGHWLGKGVVLRGGSLFIRTLLESRV